jgi:hypothetical protein
MCFFTPLTSIRRAGASLLVLVVGLLLVPASVEAGCGDYVLIGSQHTVFEHEQANTVSEISLRASGVTFHTEPRSNSKPVRTPCRGPNCSDRSKQPAAPQAQINQSVDRWACCVSKSFASRLSTSSSLLAEPCIVIADSCGLSILRPPR